MSRPVSANQMLFNRNLDWDGAKALCVGVSKSLHSGTVRQLFCLHVTENQSVHPQGGRKQMYRGAKEEDERSQ